MLTFKRKLMLTTAQSRRIDCWIGTCRMVYNLGLEVRIAAYRNKQQSVHKFDLLKQLTEIRQIDWIAECPRDVQDNAIYRLDLAYDKFFKGGGFPKWASKRSYKSITFFRCLYAKENLLKIPRMGWVKMFKDTPISSKIKTVTIKKEITGYYAFITTGDVKSIQNQDENQVLGLDMGVTHFAVDSNGRFIANPCHFKAYERQLRIENRSLARKKKGGKNWRKQARRLSLLHHKIRNVRKDFLHKESTKIATAYHTVILEDLNIAAMAKSKLSKSIFDAGWGYFRLMLEYKTDVVAINPKYTSQICNSCGKKDAKSRISQSKFVCTSCGESTNADENAAINILGKGLAHIRERKTLV